ncbi:MAG: ABC transporter ATP-binding protein [Mycoplasmoidaceae bacterium]
MQKNTSNFDKLFTKANPNKNKQEKNKQAIKELKNKQAEIMDQVKLTDEDEKFLLELEEKLNEAETFSESFNEAVLSEVEYHEDKNNLSYQKTLEELLILRKINLENVQQYHDIIFNDFEKRIFNSFQNPKRKLKYLDNLKEKKIFYKIHKLKSIKRSLLLRKNSDDCIIDIKNLYKVYESRKNNNFVLNDINLSIKKGEIVALIGPSGSGKTTLMNLMSGIDSLTAGEIVVNNINISKMGESELTRFRLENIGYVFQNYGLIPNLTVEENIAIGGYMGYLSRKEKKGIKYDNYFNQKEVERILKILYLTDYKDQMPYQLSGGQKQRVSIGRTLAKKTPIIFADEPTSSLDEENSENIIEILKQINQEFQATIIMITHNDKQVDFATRVIRLRDGIIENKN